MGICSIAVSMKLVSGSPPLFVAARLRFPSKLFAFFLSTGSRVLSFLPLLTVASLVGAHFPTQVSWTVL